MLVLLAACHRDDPAPIGPDPAFRCVGTGVTSNFGDVYGELVATRDSALRPLTEDGEFEVGEFETGVVRSRWIWRGDLLVSETVESEGSGSSAIDRTDSFYDADGRLIERRTSSRSDLEGQASEAFLWAYDADGHEVLRAWYADGRWVQDREQVWVDGRIEAIHYRSDDGDQTITRTYGRPAPDPDYVELGGVAVWLGEDGVITAGQSRVEVLHDADGNEVSRDTTAIASGERVRTESFAWEDGRLVERARTEVDGTHLYETWTFDERGLPLEELVDDTSHVRRAETATTWTWDCP